MSYSAVESSQLSGNPIEFYRFTIGTRNWYYCSGDEAQEYLTNVYTPITIGRRNIRIDQEITKAQLEIEMPASTEVAAEFIPGAPNQVVNLRIYRKHRTDAEVILFWSGRVINVAFEDLKATVQCEPIFTFMRQPGLKIIATKECQHNVYDIGCQAIEADFQVTGTISAILASDVVQVAAAASHVDGWWVAGTLKKFSGESRTIRAHSSTTITLLAPMVGLKVGDLVFLSAGCDHLKTTCISKFNNVPNFGGQPWLPEDNPFTGDAAF